ncbi:MAG: redox-regulated ATPase YchF [Firmicutes bacterium]|nr:redox-regulated ATPase YchF [Bacillota bacterium]
MSLSVGIVGLPNVGKSTLFNALTENNVLAANYPFATIEPNVGVVGVPDERLAHLAKLYDSQKIIHSTVTFVDIAGIVKGAAQGEGLGNKFLAAIREADVICQVVRVFSSPDIIHVSGNINPGSDIETVNIELILADIETLDSRIAKITRETRSKPDLIPVMEALQFLKAGLEEGKTAQQILTSEPGITLEKDENIHKHLKELHLLSAKQFIYTFNVDDKDLNNVALQDELTQLVSPSPAVFISAELEAEMNTLDEEEKKELLSAYEQSESGLVKLIRVAFSTLGLQSFLTAGPKEVRSWTIKTGSKAPEAAGAIHSDFQKGFIKAEIINYDDLLQYGSLQAARGSGKVRIEGKDYVMRDGDVVEFKFNV